MRSNRSRIMATIAASLFGAMVVSCSCNSAHPSIAPSVDDAAAKSEVEAAMQHYTALLRSGPPSATAAMFTADGELIEPGMDALTGPGAIRNFLEPVMAAVTVESASTKTDSIEVHGRTAEQWGTYEQRIAEHGKEARDYRGRYVVDWRRDTDGQWRIRRFIVQPTPM